MSLKLEHFLSAQDQCQLRREAGCFCLFLKHNSLPNNRESVNTSLYRSLLIFPFSRIQYSLKSSSTSLLLSCFSQRRSINMLCNLRKEVYVMTCRIFNSISLTKHLNNEPERFGIPEEKCLKWFRVQAQTMEL